MIKPKQSLSYPELAIRILLGLLCLPVALVAGVGIGLLIGAALLVVFGIASIMSPFWASSKIVDWLFYKFDMENKLGSRAQLLAYVVPVAILGLCITPAVAPAMMIFGVMISALVAPLMMLFISGAFAVEGQKFIYNTGVNLLTRPIEKDEVVTVFDSQLSFGDLPTSQPEEPYQPTGTGFLSRRRGFQFDDDPANARIESGNGTEPPSM